ncbi:hypothetical protein GWK47_035889 [Chionoecetes opilio]|uniref:Uncharacterized protein n=1 Tax=Chionoecetes opilio TaxID=41210 RepID=A0A8J4YGC4_CHIOP|nr:hypothetical protein GWK47_035889 [Chionoecetes opilio]
MLGETPRRLIRPRGPPPLLRRRSRPIHPKHSPQGPPPHLPWANCSVAALLWALKSPRVIQLHDLRPPSPSQPLQIRAIPSGTSPLTSTWAFGFYTNLSFRPQVRHLRDPNCGAGSSTAVPVWGGHRGPPKWLKECFTPPAIRSVLDYCAPCLPGIAKSHFQSLEVVQNGP